MRVKPPTLPRYISIMRIICDAKLNFGVIPKVNPTVPIADAVSNRLATNGNFSIVQIETPPIKKSVMYIITIVDAFFITLSSILLPNAQTFSFRLKQAKALRISTAIVVVLRPPAVEPGEPPTSIRKIIIACDGRVNFVKSVVLKPAVLVVTDWNREASNLLPML